MMKKESGIWSLQPYHVEGDFGPEHQEPSLPRTHAAWKRQGPTSPVKAKRESKIAIGDRPPGVPGGSGRLSGVGLCEGVQREKLTRLPARGDSAADSALLDANP